MTQEELRELLNYDPDTGVFTRKVARGPARSGAVVGYARRDGYLAIKVNYNLYLAHRLAFLYMEGEFPPEMCDHINGCKADNRWVNLRHATRAENCQNSATRSDNTSRVKGVGWDKATGKWRARAGINGKQNYLGRFVNLEDAKAAVREARTAAHGEFVNHGNEELNRERQNVAGVSERDQQHSPSCS